MWTGCTTEIHMFFQRERYARWAKHIAEDMIRLIYCRNMSEEYPWVKDAAKLPSLCERYFAYREEAATISLWRNSALDFVERHRTRLDLGHLEEIQRTACFDNGNDLFPSLCFACALRFPQVCFTALFRWEMTVTGSVQLLRAQYDGRIIHVQKMIGERPFDERNWSSAPVRDYVVADETFGRRERTYIGTNAAMPQKTLE